MENKLAILDSDEQEISLRSAFFHVLFRWRSILIAALIGAIALGCYQYFSLKAVHDEGKQTLEEQQFEVELQTYQASLETYRRNIKSYSLTISDQRKYLAESVWINMDADSMWRGESSFYVEIDPDVLAALPEGSVQDPADYVLNAYNSALRAGLDSAELEAMLGTSKRQYVNELTGLSLNSGGNIMALWVIAPDEETARARLDYFQQQLTQIGAQSVQQVAAHTLLPISTDVYTYHDGTLATRQTEIAKIIADAQTAMQKDQQSLLKAEDDGEPDPPGDHIKKYAAIGFLLFGVMLAGCYLLQYVMSSKLHAADDLTVLFGLPVWGDFVQDGLHKGAIDRWLQKKANKNAVTDRAAVEQGIAALLQKNAAGQQVLLTGTADAGKIAQLRDALQPLAQDVTLTAAPDVRTSGDALTAAAAADAVLFVEEKEVSRMSMVQREAELLLTVNATTVGCIAL